MVDRCKHCKRPEWTEAAEDLVTVCFSPGDANCELACRVAELELLRDEIFRAALSSEDASEFNLWVIELAKESGTNG